MKTEKKRRAKTIILSVTLLGIFLIAVGIDNWVENNQSLFLDPIWEERPDVGLALYWVDTITPIEEKDWLAEIGVWYLTQSEYPLLYERLDGRLLRNCSRGGLGGKLGPQDYALRILGAKGDQRSIDILYEIATKPSVDGVDHCRLQGGQGLALMGEDVVPMMVQIATDESIRNHNRRFAIYWLWEMGIDEYKFYCLERLGCEPFGSEWGKQWTDLFYSLALNEPDDKVRSAAISVLVEGNDPRAEEVLRNELEIETDVRRIQYFEALLERVLSGN